MRVTESDLLILVGLRDDPLISYSSLANKLQLAPNTVKSKIQTLKEKGILKIKDGDISAKIKFPVSLTEYEIKVENIYRNTIKDEILLKIHFDYKPYTQ